MKMNLNIKVFVLVLSNLCFCVPSWSSDGSTQGANPDKRAQPGVARLSSQTLEICAQIFKKPHATHADDGETAPPLVRAVSVLEHKEQERLAEILSQAAQIPDANFAWLVAPGQHPTLPQTYFWQLIIEEGDAARQFRTPMYAPRSDLTHLLAYVLWLQKRDPTNPTYLSYLAVTFQRLGFYKAAGEIPVTDLLSAEHLIPRLLDVREPRAAASVLRTFWTNNTNSNAEFLYESAMEIMDALLYRFYFYAAQELAQDALDRGFTDNRLSNQIYRSFMGTNDAEAGALVAERQIRLQPEELVHKINYIRLLLRTGKLEDTHKAYRLAQNMAYNTHWYDVMVWREYITVIKAVQGQASPDNQPLRTALKEAVDSAPAPVSASARMRAIAAQLHILLGKVENAVQILESIDSDEISSAETNRERADIYEQMGLTALALGDARSAVPNFIETLKHFDASNPAAIGLVQAYYADSNFRIANAAALRLIRDQMLHPIVRDEATFIAFKISLFEGNLERAQSLYHKSRSQSAFKVIMEASLAAATGDIPASKKIMARAGNQPQALWRLSEILANAPTPDYEGAHEALLKILKLNRGVELAVIAALDKVEGLMAMGESEEIERILNQIDEPGIDRIMDLAEGNPWLFPLEMRPQDEIPDYLRPTIQ